jgi:type IX secretion system PorP/SprF family membrane protein
MRRFLLIACVFPVFLHAQDIHFSQFFQVPLGLSPAAIGAFEGDYRVHGVFRQQWRSVTVPYRTFALGGDARNVKGVEGLGAGIWMYNDRAGDGNLNTFHLSIGASYRYDLPDNEGHSIQGGFQAGFTNITLDPNEFRWDAQYNGSFYDPNLSSGETFQRDGLTHSDVHLGVMYRFFESHRISQQAGVALYNITTPEIGFFDSPGAPLDMRFVVHAIVHRPMNELWDIQPMFQYMQQGKFTEFDIGASVRRVLYDQYGFVQAVRAGLYYRSKDAGYIFAGLDQGDWQFGLSYDINLSQLVPASRNRGGLEMSAVYIIRKRPIPKKYRVCPIDI